MKIAIKVLTEWDRENVIAFFEKHFPECNYSNWGVRNVDIAELWMLEYNRRKQIWFLTFAFTEDLSDYTILNGIPTNMELPKVETTPTREQELEDCLRKCHSGFVMLRSILKQYKIGGEDVANETLNQINNLLNQKLK